MTDLTEEDVEEAFNRFVETAEQYREQEGLELNPVQTAAALTDKVVSSLCRTWKESFHALALVQKHHGYEASVQCGEVDDPELRQKFLDEGQNIVGDTDD